MALGGRSNVPATMTLAHSPVVFFSIYTRSEGGEEYEIYNCLSCFEKSVLFIHLNGSAMPQPIIFGLVTSRSLKAALLFKPCTLASLAYLSLF